MKIEMFYQAEYLIKSLKNKTEFAENPLKSKRTKSKTMVQNQPKVITRNWLLLFLFAAFLPTFSFGQSSVTIGATSGSSHFVYGPYYRSSASSSFNYSKFAYLYTASELSIPAGSTITKVEWLKASGTVTGSNTFNVWMKNASSNSLTNNSTWNSLVASASQVYSSASQSFAAANDSWEEVNLSSSFTYNGGSLQIMTDFAFSGTASAANNFYVNAANGKALGWATTTPIAGTMTLTASSYGDNRPTVRITYSSGTACSGTPTAGAATSSASGAVCSGTSVELNLSGNSVGSGITYQWQESTNNSTWSNMGSSSTVSAVTINPTSSKYYRTVVTCSSNSSTSSSVQVAVNAAFAGGTYTINPGAAASSTNFQTFTAFANALGCSISGPVVVNVTAGTYNEQFKLGAVGGTSATNTITINGGGATISNVSISSNDRGVVTLDGTDYVTISNLNITSSSSSNTSYGWGVFITNDADHNTISGCTITLNSSTASSNYAGIVVSGSSQSATAPGSNCDYTTINNNTIIGGYYGISLVGNISTTTDGQVISNNTVKDFYLYGIYTGGINSSSIFSNNIHRLTRSSNINDFYGIWVYNNSTNVSIYKNRIHDPATLAPQSSFTFDGIGFNNAVSSGNIVYNNIFYNIQGNGEQNSLYNNASDVKWYYNSVASDYPATTGGNTRGFYQLNASSTGSTITVKNNNFSITRGGNSGTRTCIDLSNNSANIVKSNNNYFGSSNVNIGSIDGTAYSSLSNWQSATTDNSSISSNPNFVSATGGNLQPTAPSLNGAAVVIAGITTDFNANTRNVTTPDIGAYDFNVTTCSGTPSTPVFNPTSSTACAGVSFGMALASFPTGNGITYQWQSSPNNSTWSNISGATTPTYTASQSSVTYYRVQATCTNSSITVPSNVMTVNMSANSLCYCASYAVGSNNSEVTSVTFGNLSNTSTCTTTGGTGSMQGLYSNYTSSVSPSLVTKGSNVPLSIEVGTCDNAANGFAKAYIDFNIDGDFDDAGEEVFVSDAFVSNNGTTVSGIVAIPLTATAGSTRMRVVMMETSNAADITPCGTYSFGETEDYAVTIAGNTGTQPTVTLSTVASTSVKLSILNGTGISGTFIVASTAPLTYDPVNFTSYACQNNASTVSYDTLGTSMANGYAVVTSTGKNAKTVSVTIKGLRSGIRYYFSVYSYTTAVGGRVYNSAVSVDTLTTVVAPNVKAIVSDVLSNEKDANTAILRWTNGNGAGRIVVIAKNSLAVATPTTDQPYSGNTSFGNGDAIASTNYIVRTISDYAPSQNDSVVVTNLEAGAKYTFTVYEFNGIQQTGEAIRYGGAASKKIFTTSVDFVSVAKNLIGVGYTQDFDGMNGTSQLPVGWHSTGTLTEDDGTSSASGNYNYGSTSSSNRSLGSLGASNFGIRIKNSTTGNGSITWTSLLVKYTGKQWRNGDGSNDALTVQYSTDAYMFNDANVYSSNSSATWTNASSNLTFTAPQTAPSNSSIDGDVNGNFTTKLASIVASVPAQSYIWIRWVNSNGAVVSDGLAVDDVTIIPFSETYNTNDVVTAGTKVMGLNIVGNASVNGNVSVKHALNIEAGATLDLTALPTKFTINETHYGTGKFSVDGDDDLIIGSLASNPTIYCDATNNVFKSLLIKGSTTLGNATHVNSYVTVDGATLTTGGNLTLDATVSSAAYIGKLLNGGSVSGDVTVKVVTSSYPNYRFIGHPFSSAIPVSQLNDNMTLDLSGGSNQNLWYYDPSTSGLGGGSLLALSSSSVWTGYTSLTDNWSSNTGIRVYTNADQTLDMTGPVNQNSVTVTKTAGLSGITSVGNPYPAPVKLLATNIPGGVSSIYYWNPNTNGGVGSWTTKTGTKIQNLIIPMCGSFIAVSAPSATTSWTFAESDKQKSSVITNYFRPSDENDNSIGLTLNINKGANFLDELSVYFDDKSSSVNEFSTDGIKMANPGLDFYTKSADNIELAVDSRKYINGSIIPVGINKAQVGKYSINVAEWTVPSTTPVYLVDAYTNKTVSLSSNSIYSFNIDNNPNSQGNKRFYLQLGKQVNVENLLSVNIAPNPATDFITLSVNGNLDGNASVKVISMTGTVMINTTMESIAHSQLSIPVNQLSAGVYIVDVTVNGNRMTKQFVKQ